MSPVRHSVVVRCPVDHAFAVFTERVDLWWPPTHRRLSGSRLVLEPGPEGRLCEQGPDGTTLEIGRIITWDPPASLSFAWRLGAPADAPTSVRIAFVAQQDSTLVEVVHLEGPRPLPDWVATAQIFTRSWSHVLGAFQHHLETP